MNDLLKLHSDINANSGQGKNYLEVYDLEIGLLLNFGSTNRQFKSLFNDKAKKRTVEQ